MEQNEKAFREKFEQTYLETVYNELTPEQIVERLEDLSIAIELYGDNHGTD